MPIDFSDSAKALLDGPHFAQLATVDAEGFPLVDTLWLGREDQLLVIATTHRTRKARNLLANGKAAIVVTALDNPYEQLQLRCRLHSVRDDQDMATCDWLSEIYTGGLFPKRHYPERIALLLEPYWLRYHKVPLAPPGINE